MTRSYFITGTDTEVGKTVTSIVLLQAAQAAGFTTAGYKPVASNSKITAEGLRNSDVLALQRNSNITLTYEAVNQYTFVDPVPPHIVSIYEKRPISLKMISAGLRTLETKADYIFIEGAGGWFTPLTEKKTFADWVISEQLQVILVVGIKLGCINHALLTALAIKQANLHLVGWIANEITAPDKYQTEYITTLKGMLSVPFLGKISWSSDLEKYKPSAEYLNLRYLKYY